MSFLLDNKKIELNNIIDNNTTYISKMDKLVETTPLLKKRLLRK